jgi:hypothetical protein
MPTTRRTTCQFLFPSNAALASAKAIKPEPAKIPIVETMITSYTQEALGITERDIFDGDISDMDSDFFDDELPRSDDDASDNDSVISVDLLAGFSESERQGLIVLKRPLKVFLSGFQSILTNIYSSRSRASKQIRLK